MDPTPPMKLTSSLVLLLLSASVVLSGCRTPPKVGEVLVNVTGFRPAASSQPKNQAVMSLTVTNESVEAIALSGSTHNLYLNGTYVGKAVSDAAIGLPAVGSQTCEVTVVIENPAVVRQALAGPDQPLARYRVESVIQFDEGEERFTLKATGEGRVDVRGLAAAVR